MIFKVALGIFLTNFIAGALSESDYAVRFREEVEPFVRNRLKTGQLSGVGGVTIVYSALPGGNRGTIVIVPGRTEWSGTFTELMFDLSSQGYSVATLDHRGQGLSGRLVPGTDVGHVEEFQHYVDDLGAFLEHSVFGKLPSPYFLLADSMGAAISTLYIAAHPDAFAAAAMAAPMLRIQTRPLPETLAFGLAQLLRWLGFGANYAPTTAAYNFSARFEDNDFTHSKDRFFSDLRHVTKQPKAAVGGPSVSWVHEALKVSSRLQESARQIAIPLLFFQAGNDFYVDSDAQKAFCAAAPNCSAVAYPDAFHSLLIETDAVRFDLIKATLEHFRKNSLHALPSSKRLTTQAE